MAIIQREGATLSYSRVGRGPAVLFIQGVGVIGEGWRPQIDGLAADFSVVSFDNRGIGRSEWRGPVSIDGMAQDALAILDAEGIERSHVVGHSMGGLIAQQLALSAAGRIASLALLCTFAAGAQGARVTPDIVIAGLRTRVGTRRMRRLAFLELIVPPRVLAREDRDGLAERLRPLFGHDLADQPSIVMPQLAAMKQYDARDQLRQLGGIPTLVVSAADDRIALPAYGRELAACIPGARYVEMSNAGHGAPIHCAVEMNRLLRQHWRVIDRPSSASSADPP